MPNKQITRGKVTLNITEFTYEEEKVILVIYQELNILRDFSEFF